MKKNLFINKILFPGVYKTVEWGFFGAILGIFSLYFINIFSGPVQVIILNAPYTVIPVIILTYAVTHLKNKEKKTAKYHELLDTVHMNLYVSIAYLICQIIVYISTKSLNYNNENDLILKYRVYLGIIIGIALFIISLFLIKKYLN